jgi:hypothetical protein
MSFVDALPSLRARQWQLMVLVLLLLPSRPITSLCIWYYMMIPFPDITANIIMRISFEDI